MKKSKKQIPNIKFRKFAPGGTMNFDESTYNSSLPSTNGNIDYMNDKRTKGLSSNQYMAAAGALTTGLGNMSNVYNDPNATSRNKDEALSSTVTGTIGAVNPAVGSIIGVGDAIGKPIRTGLEKTDPVTGKLVDRGGAKAGAVIGSFFSPSKMIGVAAEGNWDITGNKYADNLEKEALDNINAQKAQDAAYNQQMQAQQQQQAQYNLMFQDYQSRNKQFAQGGMNMLPNAEVEKQENSVAPNGQFTQFNGPDHSNGGVKTQLAPGEMVFSDRLKLGKKTFAQLNKSNNTNKEDKILEDSKSGNISTRTAALMKMAKLKSSEELFNIQEQLKQSKVENYAKKMGVSLPQMLPSNDQNQQYSYGGMNLPKYPDGVRFGGSEDRKTFLENKINNELSTPNYQYYDKTDYKNIPQSSYAPGVLGYNNSLNSPQNPYVKPVDNTDYQKINQDSYDEDLKKALSKEDTTKTSWIDRNKDNLYNLGFGLAENAGQLAYLTEQGKKYDKQQFYNYNPALLDPTAALRDAEQENRRAEVDIRNATSGNAGNYLSNRVALSTKNALNKDRVRQQYANNNAQIANRATEMNIANKYQTDDTNAANKGQALTNYYKTIGSVGVNTAQQIKDNKYSEMDYDKLDTTSELYNNPRYRKYIEDYKKKKGKKS